MNDPDVTDRPPQSRPARSRVWLLAGGGALLVLALILVAGLLRPSTPALTGAMPSMASMPAPSTPYPAPDFSAMDLDGQPVQLRALRGQPVWINFWATWCVPCKAEMPRMAAKYAQYRPQGLVIVGIDLQESPDVVRAWVTGHFSWRFVIDQDLRLANRYELYGLPAHVFIDRAGQVRGQVNGELTEAQMDSYLAPILAP